MAPGNKRAVIIALVDPEMVAGSAFVRGAHFVLHKKQAQQEQLGQQIEALQGAAQGLAAVQHLLDEEDQPIAAAHKAGS